jgi:cytoskeletal protein CcmA (bactofilin family)
MAVLDAVKNVALPISRLSAEPAPFSILATGVRLTGTLETSGVLRVEGVVAGDLRALGGQVLVARGGVIEGDVETSLAVVEGEVRGGIVADELVELKAGGLVLGDITTHRITVEEGATLNGTLHMNGKRATENGKGEAG